MWLRFTWVPDKRCALSGMTTRWELGQIQFQTRRRPLRAASAEGLTARTAAGSRSERADQHSRWVKASARPMTAITVTRPNVSRMAIIDITVFPSTGICRTFRLNRRIEPSVP